MIEGFISFFDYFQQNAADVMGVATLLQVTIALLVYFAGRCFFWFKMEDIPLKDIDPVTKRRRGYIIGHIWTEFFIGYGVAYLVILLRGANSYQVIYNTFVGPGLGIVSAIMIDHTFLMAKEHHAPKGFRLSSEQVTETTTHHDSSSHTSDSDAPNDGDVEYISPDLAYSAGFGERIIKEINKMKDEDASHKKDILLLVDTCKQISTAVKELQEAETQRYGIDLKRKMYSCLSKGYATPEEFEQIEVEYNIYHEILHGNGHIQNLHDTKFSELDVHDSTNSLSVAPCPVTTGHESPAPLCTYSKFDDDESDHISS